MKAWKWTPVGAFVKVPIFYKVILANSAMACVVIVSMTFFHNQGGAVAAVVFACGVINALLVRAALAFEEMQKQQRELLAWTYRENERERSRVVSEIHDGAAQRLAALLVASRDQGVSAEAAAVMQDLSQTAETLQPPGLSLLGLKAALNWYSRSVQSRLGIDVALQIDCDLKAIDPSMSMGLYRIIEDAIETIALRAPERIDVCIACTEETVASSISAYHADGAEARFTAAERFRLAERAAVLGGRFAADYHDDCTVVHLTTPTRERHVRHDSRLAG